VEVETGGPAAVERPPADPAEAAVDAAEIAATEVAELPPGLGAAAAEAGAGAAHPRRGFVHDVASVFGSRLLVLAIGMLTSVLLARTLGPTGRGELAVLLVVPTLVLTLADLGLKQAAVYLVGQRVVPVQQVVQTVLFLVFATSPVCLLVITGVYAVQGTTRYGALTVAMAMAAVPLTLLATYTRGVALGLGQIRTYNRVLWYVSPLNLAGIAVLVGVLGLGVRGALGAYLVSAALVAGYSLRFLAGVAPPVPRYVRGLPTQMVRLGIVYSAATFALLLSYRVDVMLLQRAVSEAQVGLYTLGSNLAELVWQIPAAITPVVFSRSANSRDPQAFSRRMARLLRLTLLAGMAAGAVFFVAAPWVIPLAYGEAFRASVGVHRMLLPGIVVSLVYHLLHSDLQGKGRPLVSLSVFLPVAVLNVVLNLLWIPRWGILGSAAASSVTYTCGAVALAVVYARICGLPLAELFIPRAADFDEIRARLGAAAHAARGAFRARRPNP
jgi:O-antigen/teichoic acid export membrane protein